MTTLHEINDESKPSCPSERLEFPGGTQGEDGSAETAGPNVAGVAGVDFPGGTQGEDGSAETAGPNVAGVAGVDLTSSQQLGSMRNCYGILITKRDLAILRALESHRKRFDARKDRKDLTIGQRKYAAQRKRSCGIAHSHRVASCGTGPAFYVKCGCSTAQVDPRCNVRASCEKCSDQNRRAYSKKMEIGLRGALEELRDSKRGRGAAMIRMVTLTIRHTGDVAADRDSINKAWRLWRRWFAYELGYAPDYVGAWEITAGHDGLGHVHLHVCFVSTNFDYAHARIAWQSAINDEGAQWDVVSSKNARASCRYVSKYIGKVADNLPVEVEAAWIGAQYGKRTVTASRGMLKKQPCARCRQHWGVDYRHLEFLQAPVDLVAAQNRLEVALSIEDAWGHRMCDLSGSG